MALLAPDEVRWRVGANRAHPCVYPGLAGPQPVRPLSDIALNPSSVYPSNEHRGMTHCVTVPVMNLNRLACPLATHPHAALTCIALACFGLVAGGVALQLTANIQPCPLCIFQRYAYIVTGALALAGALHRGPYLVSRIWAALVTLSALTGLGIAARQVWLQHNPPAVSECGADLEFMLESFPLTQALPMVFRGTGDCSKVDWTLLGLSIAEWSIVCFGLVALCALAVATDRHASRPR